MITDLIKEYFDFFDGNTLFNTFDAIMRYEKKFDSKDDRELIEQLYLFLIELSDHDEDLFSENQEKILELYYIAVYVQSNLFTDDSFKVIVKIFISFQFNEVVRELNEMLESLE